MTATITVYGKPACGQCTLTENLLDRAGVDYQKVDIAKDDQALAAITALGYMQAPVVVVRAPGATADLHWSGFQPERLKDVIAGRYND